MSGLGVSRSTSGRQARALWILVLFITPRSLLPGAFAQRVSHDDVQTHLAPRVGDGWKRVWRTKLVYLNMMREIKRVRASESGNELGNDDN